MTKIPTLTIEVGGLPNPNSTGQHNYYTSAWLTVDVLSVHFAANSMRIGFVWLGKKMTRDTSLEYFHNQYTVMAK